MTDGDRNFHPVSCGAPCPSQPQCRLLSPDHFLAIAFSSIDTLMATVSINGPLCIWDVATGESTVTYKVNSPRIEDVMFLPESEVEVIPSSDEQYSGSVWLVDATTGKRVKPLKGHVDNVMSVRFMPKQKLVVPASMDGAIKFWDVDPAKLK